MLGRWYIDSDAVQSDAHTEEPLSHFLQNTLFPGWILSQTGGTIKVTAGKPYLRVFKYFYLSNFGGSLRC